MQWWNRIFKHVGFYTEIVHTLFCDNQQTVGIAVKAEDRLQTKLRHVDTHQMWIRQEVETGRLQISWKPTNEMPADGLTKVLPRQKHLDFVKQLGLTDVPKLTGL
jgi:hypothetical protein